MQVKLDPVNGVVFVPNGGGGTVTSVSVVSANGLAGTVADPTTTPAITLSTTITGLLKGDGTAISAAVAGTDYLEPSALSAYVPYIGATGAVDLGSQNLTTLGIGIFGPTAGGNTFNVEMGNNSIGALYARDDSSNEVTLATGLNTALFYDGTNTVIIGDQGNGYAINALGRSYFEVGGTDTAVEGYQNNNAGGAAGYFHSVAGSAYLGDVSSNRAVKAVGDVEISGYIYDTQIGTPYISIDTNNRQLFNDVGNLQYDYRLNYFYDTSGNEIARMNSNLLLSAGGITSIEWDSRGLYNTSGGLTLDWDSRQLFDASSVNTVHWDDCELKDAFGPSISWDTRIMANTATVVTIDWENCLLYNPAGLSVDWTNRTLIDSDGTTLCVDWVSRELRYNAGAGSSVAVVYWQYGSLYDPASAASADWFQRFLYESDGVTVAVDWNDATALKLPAYTTNGFLKTSAGDGTLVVSSQVDLSSEVTGDLPVTNLNGGTGASGSTYWRGDGTWASIAGGGDVVGPASAVNNNVVFFDGTTGKLIKDSGLTLAGTNTGNVTLAGTPDYITISGQVITRGLIDLATDITGDLPFANLTQGSARSVLGVTGNATADFASIQGTADQVLRVDSAGTGLAFGAINLASSSAVTGNLPVTNLNSGTSASGSTYWRGDGTWATPSAAATPGGADTNVQYNDGGAMGGNAAFAFLDTLGTGVTITQAVSTGAVNNPLLITGAAHTAISTTVEKNLVYFNFGQTHQWATGAITNQRAFRIAGETISFVGASTVTTAATQYISGAPIAGTNATLTNTYGLLIDAAAVAAGSSNSYGLLAKAQTGGTLNGAAAFTGGPVMIGTATIQSASTGHRLHIANDGAVGTGNLSLTAQASQTGRLITGTGLSGAAFYVEANGNTTISSGAIGSSVPVLMTVAPGAHTGITASTEQNDIYFNLSASKQFATGAKTTQRDFRITNRTYTAVGATTVTTAATFAVDGAPIKSTNISITDTIGIYHPGTAVSTATRSWGQYIVANTGASNNYAAYFSGLVGFNNTAPSYSAHITNLNSSTGGLRLTGVASLSQPLMLVETSTPTTVFQIDQNGFFRSQPIASSGSIVAPFRVQIPGNTSLTASTERNMIHFIQATQSWATGALTTERYFYVERPSFAFTAASTLTDGATVAIEGHPGLGANATITNAYALWVQGASGNGTNAYGLRVDNPTGSNTINRALLVKSSFTAGTPMVRYEGATSGTATLKTDTVHEDVQTTDATTTNLLTIAIPTSSVVTIRSRVQGIQTAGSGTVGHGAGYVIVGTFRNIAGTVTQIGTTTVDHSAEDNAGWNALFTISTTNVITQVTGEASKTIRWHVWGEFDTVQS